MRQRYLVADITNHAFEAFSTKSQYVSMKLCNQVVSDYMYMVTISYIDFVNCQRDPISKLNKCTWKRKLSICRRRDSTCGSTELNALEQICGCGCGCGRVLVDSSGLSYTVLRTIELVMV